VSIDNLATGALIWFLLLLIVSHIYFPGGSYLLVWPLLAALITWILKFTLPAGKLSLPKLCLIAAVCAVPGIILISPLIYQTFVALGISQTSLIVVPVALLLGLLVINFESIASGFRWLLPAVSTLAAACFIVAALLQPDYSNEQPRSNELFYVLNADTGKAVWVSSDARPDEWTSQVLSSDAPAGECFYNSPLRLQRLPRPRSRSWTIRLKMKQDAYTCASVQFERLRRSLSIPELSSPKRLLTANA
jgi:hypothetical protein